MTNGSKNGNETGYSIPVLHLAGLGVVKVHLLPLELQEYVIEKEDNPMNQSVLKNL